MTKFRLSTHYLPIERERYSKPKLPRHLRICTLCKTDIGDELHALFQCKNAEIQILNDKFMTQIQTITPQIKQLPKYSAFLYLLKGTDTDIIPITGEWLYHVNKLYKKHIGLCPTRGEQVQINMSVSQSE